MAKKILFPVDLSDEHSWEKALGVAIGQVRADGGALHVATVLPELGMSMVGAYLGEGFERKALHSMGESLSEWIKEHVPEDIEVHPHVLHGPVYHEILRAADELGVDLIVIGSHRPALKDYLLGPNAARVVRHARQSVYVVRG
jgi:nucleotide-binding universal stress UspA family protein